MTRIPSEEIKSGMGIAIDIVDAVELNLRWVWSGL